MTYGLLRLKTGPKIAVRARETRKWGTLQEDFCKRPQMENLSAPVRSLRRDGKFLYITLLHLSSLTRRKRPWKIEGYRNTWGPQVSRQPPRGTDRTHNS